MFKISFINSETPLYFLLLQVVVMNVILKSLRGPRLYHICQVGPGDIIQDYSFEHEGFFERLVNIFEVVLFKSLLIGLG